MPCSAHPVAAVDLDLDARRSLRALAERASGVRSLAGVSCRSRAKFCASAPTAPRWTASATS